MEPPRTGEWSIAYEYYHSDTWTNECQGVASDGACWYFARQPNAFNADRHWGIYRIPMNNKLRGADMEFFEINGHGHVGAIDYRNGNVYVALGDPAAVLVLSADFQQSRKLLIRRKDGGPSPQGESLPWVAVHPWNGLVYSSAFGDDGDITEIYGYEDTGERLVLREEATIHLRTPARAIQGGCFSKRGRLLLASNDSCDIRVYSSLNGHLFGTFPIQVDRDEKEEIEGLTIAEGLTYNGVPTHVHLILLDNDDLSRDGVFFKHISVPDPDLL